MNLIEVKGFSELTEGEQLDVQGGVAPLVVAGVVVGAVFVGGLVVGAIVGYNEAKRNAAK
ncbi:lactobin A/cerein 7B family class IIb bacteriocin [Anaerobacterium chartisolvens]|uniref:Lactobin A/cerein 7B family class IIb bacteriocin n=1 Tax=Anaerobacterium chartisolvens TaxID=1297424 RepID=A0A369ATL6_9FIRM|nr:class IIb bacteriocin, lactobin A/cerein 7B family [Anaerobacterium chartisolvens]RCX12343.1 lactobin A/cerein 7B family class IIb bacteriocin [Anaerobacterium chartisolvens]